MAVDAIIETRGVSKRFGGFSALKNVSVAVERGKLTLHGAYFGVATGRLSVRNPATDRFEQVATEEYARMFAAPRF